MGRVIFSNSKKEYNFIEKEFERIGFALNTRYEGDNYWVSTFNKLIRTTENFIRLNNGDFVASSGTIIYDNKRGVEALRLLYDRFEDNIDDLREQTIGNYAIIIQKNSYIYVFVDKYNIYKLYYNISNDRFIISNCLYRIAVALPNPIVNKNNLIEGSFQYSILGSGTIFDDVKVLEGKEYIKFDIKAKRIEKIPITRKLTRNNLDKNMSIDEMAKELANIIREHTKSIASNFGTVALNLTGGLDSRLILASFLSVGVKPKIIYGVGNSPLTNTKTRDLEINKIFSEKFGLEFYQMDWTTDDKFIDSWDALLDKYGYHYSLYGGNTKIFNEYESLSLKNDFFEFGYFGELLRNTPWLEQLQKEYFSLDEYINGNFYGNYTESLYSPDQFIAAIRDKYMEIINNLGMDPLKISKDDFTKIHVYYRISADTVMINNLNLMSNSIIILSNPKILEYIIQVPYEYKKNGRFQLKVISYLYPKVLEIPFFSHCEDHHFDENRFELLPSQKQVSIRRNILVKLFKYIPSFKLKDRLKLIGYQMCFFPDSKTKGEVVESIKMRARVTTDIEYLQKLLDLQLINSNLFEGNIASLYFFNQNLILINKVLQVGRSGILHSRQHLTNPKI